MIDKKLHGDVVELTLDNPPVNALGLEVRRALMAAILSADADPDIKAIVIRGAGKMFSAGADISEFGTPPVSPWLPDVVARIETCSKPVIVAIHGTALGGGLEVALGAHHRIATPSATLGLPEVKIGLLPGAGGTQRLPRLIGVAAALDIIVSGDPVSAERALELGLIDKIVSEDALLEEALVLARTTPAVRRVGGLKASADPDVFAEFVERNAGVIGKLDAPKACVEAVKAATEFPLDEGQTKETELFAKLVAGTQSTALRHAFFAERAAAKIDNLPADTKPRAIGRVGVLGAGTMGGGISMNFLSAGIPVTIVETTQDVLDRGVALMRRNYEASAAKGRITPAQVEGSMSLLTPTLDFGALVSCDLVIEAVYENMDLKKQIFARLDGIAKPGAILASNTSYLDIDEIAAVTSRPGDVVGMHFFSPANVMKLLEVVRGAKTDPAVLQTAMTVGRKVGKVPVVSGVCYGFIGNRMLEPRQAQADMLLLEGALPHQIDKVHTDLGMPMGPYQMWDLAGVDIGWHRDSSRADTIKDALCAQGRWGQKTQKGYYDYDENRRRTSSAITEEIINAFRAKAGKTPREISDEEITVRTLYTMVNEAALILEEGIAQRASDIDVVWLYGYGWPRHRGGPMCWADSLGLDTIVSGLERYAEAMGAGFRFSELLRQKARDRETFV
jgi:3-hydroxyacyl-CoA dehydrogenase